MDAPTATRCMDIIEGTELNKAHRSGLTNAIMAKIAQEASQAGGPKHPKKGSSKWGGPRLMQSHLYTHNWLPCAVWITMADKHLSDQAKIDALTQLFLDLGLIMLNQTTLAHVVAVWILIEHGGSLTLALKVKPETAYSRIKALQESVRTMRGQTIYPWTGTIAMYEATPEMNFKATFPDAYAMIYGHPERNPVKYPWDALTAKDVIHFMGS